jgi:lipopolysaccharide export system permease protein
MNKTKDAIYDPKMLSVRQLGHTLDSIYKNDSVFKKKIVLELTPFMRFLNYKDSSKVFDKVKAPSIKNFNQIISDSSAKESIDNVSYQMTNIIDNLENIRNSYQVATQSKSIHAIEWHRKFTLSFACIVLFLIGAPLGSIIRKGGLGTPLVFAVVFFVIFFLLNNFGEKLAKSGEWSVFSGMWMSSILLIPVGFFLTYKAMRDSQLFNKEFYYRVLQPIKVTLRKYFKK